jgi:hypothetical protein
MAKLGEDSSAMAIKAAGDYEVDERIQIQTRAGEQGETASSNELAYKVLHPPGKTSRSRDFVGMELSWKDMVRVLVDGLDGVNKISRLVNEVGKLQVLLR